MEEGAEGSCMCEKCCKSPEEYIQLNCTHNFCLMCLLVMESKSIKLEDQEEQYLCEITCELCT